MPTFSSVSKSSSSKMVVDDGDDDAEEQPSEEEFDIEHIVTHGLVHELTKEKSIEWGPEIKNPYELRFQVRWFGYGPGDDTFEPIANLDGAQPFDKYCRQRPKLIEFDKKRSAALTKEWKANKLGAMKRLSLIREKQITDAVQQLMNKRDRTPTPGRSHKAKSPLSVVIPTEDDQTSSSSHSGAPRSGSTPKNHEVCRSTKSHKKTSLITSEDVFFPTTTAQDVVKKKEKKRKEEKDQPSPPVHDTSKPVEPTKIEPHGDATNVTAKQKDKEKSIKDHEAKSEPKPKHAINGSVLKSSIKKRSKQSSSSSHSTDHAPKKKRPRTATPTRTVPDKKNSELKERRASAGMDVTTQNTVAQEVACALQMCKIEESPSTVDNSSDTFHPALPYSDLPWDYLIEAAAYRKGGAILEQWQSTQQTLINNDTQPMADRVYAAILLGDVTQFERLIESIPDRMDTDSPPTPLLQQLIDDRQPRNDEHACTVLHALCWTRPNVQNSVPNKLGDDNTSNVNDKHCQLFARLLTTVPNHSTFLEKQTRNAKWTPLMVAVHNNALEHIRLLLDKGADVNATDSLGRDVLQIAIAAGHTDTVQLLFYAGACSATCRDVRGPLRQLVTANTESLSWYVKHRTQLERTVVGWQMETNLEQKLGLRPVASLTEWLVTAPMLSAQTIVTLPVHLSKQRLNDEQHQSAKMTFLLFVARYTAPTADQPNKRMLQKLDANSLLIENVTTFNHRTKTLKTQRTLCECPDFKLFTLDVTTFGNYEIKLTGRWDSESAIVVCRTLLITSKQ